MRIRRVLSAQILHYYAVGAFNTFFGYGLYALLLSAGLQMYAAQIVGHVIGVFVNYFTYSRKVFHDRSASRMRFAASYAVNYVVGLLGLMSVAMVIASPYLAGFIAMLIASIINFLILRRYVFKPGASAARTQPTAPESGKVGAISAP